MISPGWATFALAVAALLVGLDHFGGYTSGWVRCEGRHPAVQEVFSGVYELLRLETELRAQEFQQAL